MPAPQALPAPNPSTVLAVLFILLLLIDIGVRLYISIRSWQIIKELKENHHLTDEEIEEILKGENL